MRATVLCSTVAALCAACLHRADRPPPAPDPPAVPDTPAPPAPPAPAAVPTPTPPPSPGATKLIVVEGFLTPESVLHDPAQDIYFVSNINGGPTTKDNRSEEHTSELQSQSNLVCRLLLEKKKKKRNQLYRVIQGSNAKLSLEIKCPGLFNLI